MSLNFCFWSSRDLPVALAARQVTWITGPLRSVRSRGSVHSHLSFCAGSIEHRTISLKRGGNPTLVGEKASLGLGGVGATGSDPERRHREVGWDSEGEEDAGDHSKISRFDFVRYDAPPKEKCR